jgi:thiamine-monophosphate kinase
MEGFKQRALQSNPRSPILRIGIGDDCAVLRPRKGHEIVVTTDLFLETVHFRRDWHSPESAGHRCLARGLSDLAAMGAVPLAAFLSIAIPQELTLPQPGKRSKQTWIGRFLDGLLNLAGQANIPLAGGDTAQAPHFPYFPRARSPSSGQPSSFFAADIVLLGAVPAKQALLRSGAHAGDLIYVTGNLGGAAAELQALGLNRPALLRSLRRPVPDRHHPHLFPEPRLEIGQRLRGRASAAMDLSDGIATDLNHLCRASGVCAVIDADRLPIHRLALNSSSPIELALNGGEDYELLFTAPASARIPRSIAGVPVQSVGFIQKLEEGASPGILIRTNQGDSVLPAMGWEHFQSNPAT